MVNGCGGFGAAVSGVVDGESGDDATDGNCGCGGPRLFCVGLAVVMHSASVVLWLSDAGGVGRGRVETGG